MQLHWVPAVTRTKHSTRQFYKICIALNKTRCCVNAFLLKPKDGHQTAQYAQQFLVIGIEKGNRQVKEASWKTQPCIPQWAGWENFLHMNEYFCPLVCVFIFLNYTHEKCRPSLSISPAVLHCLTDILFAPHLGCCFVVTSYLIVNRNIGQSAYHSVTLAPLDGDKALETSVTVG